MRWVGCLPHFTDGNTEAQRVWGSPRVSWQVYSEAFFSPSYRNSLTRFPELVISLTSHLLLCRQQQRWTSWLVPPCFAFFQVAKAQPGGP